MPYNIIIDHATTDRGDHSSRSSSFDDDGESSGDTGVHLSHSHSPRSPRSAVDSQEANEGWGVVYHENDELGPSDSASRPHTSNRERPIVEAPQPEGAARRTSYRRRLARAAPPSHPPRARRSSPQTESESLDSHDEWQGYGRVPSQHFSRQYAPLPPGFAPSNFQTYPQQSLVPLGQQQVIPYNVPPYQAAPSMPGSSYFAQHQAHVTPAMIASPGNTPYPGNPAFFSYPPHGFPLPQHLPPHPSFQTYPAIYSPAPPSAPLSPQPPPSEPPTSKDDEKFARLEKMLIEQKEEQAAREAAAAKAIKDKAAQEEADAKRATEIKEASDKAAAAAKEEAENAHKAAEEKKAAEAAAAAPPKEKDKPIKFKDAVGRKFSFPFHLCATWSGMEFLIKEAFMHIEGLGPHVAEGHYDLLGPHGEIILPHVWETVIEPDWTITMHMWPMAEEKEDEAGNDEATPDVEIIEEEKKQKKKPPPPSGFMFWTAGKKGKKGGKSKKK